MKFFSKSNVFVLKVIVIVFVILNNKIESINTNSSLSFSLKNHKTGSLLHTLKRRITGEALKNVIGQALLHKIAHELAYNTKYTIEVKKVGKNNVTKKYKEASLDGIRVLKYMHDHTSPETNTRMIFAKYGAKPGIDIIPKKLRNKIAVIVFRGTDAKSWKNIKTDLNAVPLKIENTDHYIHAGFKYALDDILNHKDPEETVYEQLKSFLTKFEYEHIIITGHSLGGALSVSMTYRLLKDNISSNAKIHLITFGSPRVGNQTFANYINDHPRIVGNLRFVYGYDIVAHVPPKTLHFGYVHAGTWIQFNIESAGSLKEGIAGYQYAKTNTIGGYNTDDQEEGIHNGKINQLVMQIGIDNFVKLSMTCISMLKIAAIKSIEITKTGIKLIGNIAVDVANKTWAITLEGTNKIKIVFTKGFQSIQYYSAEGIKHAKEIGLIVKDSIRSGLIQSINMCKTFAQKTEI